MGDHGTDIVRTHADDRKALGNKSVLKELGKGFGPDQEEGRCEGTALDDTAEDMAEEGDKTAKLQVEEKVLVERINKVTEAKRSPRMEKTKPQPIHRKRGEGGGKVKEGEEHQESPRGKQSARRRSEVRCQGPECCHWDHDQGQTPFGYRKQRPEKRG